jgi:hypothetical protein
MWFSPMRHERDDPNGIVALFQSLCVSILLILVWVFVISDIVTL